MGISRSCTWTVRETTIGPLLLAATGEGLVYVVFHADGSTTDRALARLTARLGREPVREGVQEGIRADGAPSEGDGSADDGDGSAERDDSEGDAASGAVLREAADQLDAYFRGDLREFTVPLDWSLSGGFNERVLRALLESVPYGSTAGYQDLADRVGEPGAARAVGAAMGSNPLPVVVPCHRVVERGGGIGGFGGGLETKRALLALEGVLPEPLF